MFLAPLKVATLMLVPTLVIVFLLLAVSAFFSGSETALTAVSRGRMHQLEKDGSNLLRDSEERPCE